MLQWTEYQDLLSELLSDTPMLSNSINRMDDLPFEIKNWLGKLRLLNGIPIYYLVPDEQMLPPESIRFFYVDENWIKALEDGALSLGRSLTSGEKSRSFLMDQASRPLCAAKAKGESFAVRTHYLGMNAVTPSDLPLTGCLLRSSVVRDYPGLGVNAYPVDGLPTNDDPGKMLAILRMEVLHPNSDTLFCLFEGDAYRVDIHEAPEALHYGIDSMDHLSGKKTVYPFTYESDEVGVIMDMENPKKIKLSREEGTLRDHDSSRTIQMARLSEAIGKEIEHPGKMDASKMGFEMIEGVGMVSFIKEMNA